MTAIQLNCPRCASLFQIDGSMAGQQVACPSCQQLVTIPATVGTAPPTGPAVGSPLGTDLNCPLCAGAFQVTPDMSGQQVGCPQCGSLVTVPALSGPQADRGTYAPQQPPAHTVPQSPQAMGGAGLPTPPYGGQPQPVHPPSPDLPPGAAAYGSPPATLPPGPRTPGQVPTPQAPQSPADTAPSNLAVDTPGGLPPGMENRTPLSTPSSPTKTSSDTAAPIEPRVDPDKSHETKSHATDSLVPSSAKSADFTVDRLLPPGDASRTAVPTQTTVPRAATRPAPAPAEGADSFVIVDEDGASVTLHEPVKTVGQGENERELHQLTREERARSRLRKNIVVAVVCVVIVGIVAAIMLNIR